jgi:biopolymer transport protein ExbB
MVELFERGGPVMWLLLATSLVALTFIIERAIFWLRFRSGRDQARVEAFLALVEKADYAGAAESARGSRDCVLGVLHSGLVHRNYSASDALQMAAGEAYRRMRRNLTVLDTIVTLAPLLGLLGTVIGVIHSFNMIDPTGSTNPAAATKGLAEALLNTAAGLAIAIPALLAYNFFSRRAEHVASDIETTASCMEICLARNEALGIVHPAEGALPPAPGPHRVSLGGEQ